MESALDHPAAAATDELARRLALLRPGLDQLGLPACVLDPALRYRYVNAAYEAHSGRSALEFLARAPDEIFAYRPLSKGAVDMNRLVDEALEQLGLRPPLADAPGTAPAAEVITNSTNHHAA